ncbi:agamous-like MADS-box protein AGL61 [Oryza glaberrima]|uniref:agamous-like MADS-box protein AGL61 n=1 Tax=Oryza glaberrima TaxID=4538 RepID=UPI00023DF9A8|nr:agamous-like MADS-box protein AGL61 [Oryza glaberrima]XP_052139358.1 agamous-like MADS-box protein AGL61 [Oryza glaberrima]
MRPLGRTSKGRQHIDNKERRQVTFTKRRGGLFKKASELALLAGASIAVVVFSETNLAYAFGDPSVDAVLLSYGPVPGEDAEPAPVHSGGLGKDVDLEMLRQAVGETRAEVAAEKARMRGITAKILQAKAEGRFWWDVDVGEVGEAELPEFARALKELRAKLDGHANGPPPRQQQ